MSTRNGTTDYDNAGLKGIAKLFEDAEWNWVQDNYQLSDDGLDRLRRWDAALRTEGPDAHRVLHSDGPVPEPRYFGEDPTGPASKPAPAEGEDTSLTFKARVLLALLDRDVDADDVDALAARLTQIAHGNLTYHEAVEVVRPRPHYRDVSVLREICDRLIEAGGYRGADLSGIRNADGSTPGEDIAKQLSMLLGLGHRCRELARMLALQAVDEDWSAQKLADVFNGQCPPGKMVGRPAAAGWLRDARVKVAAEWKVA